jgi:Kef-type K+ transport system membrane component KefB
MMARVPEKERIENGFHALAYGLFVPIFFVNVGLTVNVRTLQVDAYWMTLVIIVAAVLGKWLGAGLGARLGGLSLRESTQLGAGMISRGEVGLIVASVGVREGLATSAEFSSIVAMVLVSTLVTPPILRAFFARPPAEAAGKAPKRDQARVQAVPPKEETS